MINVSKGHSGHIEAFKLMLCQLSPSLLLEEGKLPACCRRLAEMSSTGAYYVANLISQAVCLLVVSKISIHLDQATEVNSQRSVTLYENYQFHT